MREKDIILSLKNREQNGLQELLTHYTPLFRYIVTPILKWSEDIEECVSDIAMRVWDNIDSYSPEKGSFTSWLTAIARNVALNRVRCSKADDTECELSDDIPAVTPTPEENLLNEELRRTLARVLDELLPRDKELFFRKYYYMQSTSQISAELGITERAVEGRLYRIKKRLRRQLGGETHD